MSFKCLTRCAPGYLSTQFIRRCDVTNRRTRSSQINCKERTTCTNSSEVKPDLCEDQEDQSEDQVLKCLTYLALEQQVAKGLFSIGQLLYGISYLTILNFVNRLIKVLKRRLK